MASETQVRLRFESKALDPEAFSVLRFSGEEAISEPFRFEIDLLSDQGDIDPDSVLGRPATLSVQRGDEGTPRKVHGILAAFEQGPEGLYGHYRYRAVLVPRLWLLSLSRQNQIYQEKSAVEIVEEELKGAQGKGPAELAAIGLTAQDFEFRLSGSYATREYVVQYNETDLAFISRLLEHAGIFYFFEHDDEREKIVFCDDNVHLPAPNGESQIAYVPPSGAGSASGSGHEDSVQAFGRTQRQITGKMILKDYNYRTPTTPLQGEAEVDDLGHGLISEYGNHFKTPEEGQALAKVRAQEILCRKAEFSGASDRLSFAAGFPFTLEEHFNGEFDQDYALIRVSHEGSQAFAETTGFPEFDGLSTTYANSFTAIPFQVAFRPARVTPRPKMHGVMNAHIDAAGPGTRAEIDGEGRYKLVMPFDLSGQAKGKATRWVRMAQPYGGSQQGMHFPLHKGTEVLWTCVDGDPDRPIITGVVPNPLNKSIVNADSNTKNRIQTASGIVIEMNDGAGPPPEEELREGAMAGQQQMLRLPAPEAARETPPATSVAPAEPRPLQAQQQRQPLDTVSESDTAGSSDVWLKLAVPNYDADSKSSYVRYGMHDTTNDVADDTSLLKDPASLTDLAAPIALGLNVAERKPDELDHHLDGVLDYTDGNRTEITTYNREVKILGRSRIDIGIEPSPDPQPKWTDYKRKVGGGIGGDVWRQTTVSYGSKDSWHVGDKEIGTFGFSFSGMAGLATGVKLGGALNVGFTADVDYGADFKVNWKKGDNVDFTAEGQNTMDAEDHDMVAKDTISLRVKGPVESAVDTVEKEKQRSIRATLGAISAAVLTPAGVAAALPTGGGSEDKASTWAARIGFPLATLGWAAAVLYGYKKNKAVDANQKSSPAQINIQENKIELLAGQKGTGSSLVMDQNSITLKVGANKIKMTRLGVHVVGDRVVEVTGGYMANVTAKNGPVTIKGTAGKQVVS